MGEQPQLVATQVMRSLSMAQTTNWRPLGTKVFPSAAARSMQLWIKTSSVDKSIMSWGDNDTNHKKWVLRTTTGRKLRV